jgi:hypothetical protein
MEEKEKGHMRIFGVPCRHICPAYGGKSAMRAAGVLGLSHVAPGGKRAPHLGAACILHYFHLEIRHLVNNRLYRIAAAIDAMFSQVLHLFLLFANISPYGVVRVYFSPFTDGKSAYSPQKLHGPPDADKVIR